MMLASFLIGFIVYASQAALGYSTAFKTSPFYFPVSVSTSVMSGFLWFAIAKRLGGDHAAVLRYGFIWDSMILLAYALVPILCFGVKLDLKTSIGLGLVVAGTVVLKWQAVA